MSELKAALEDDSTPSNQDTVSEEDDNLSDLESHTGSERDAASEAGSETPSLSDRSSQRASRSTSNTPTNTRSTRSRDNPEFVAKQKSFMAKVQAATAGSEGTMVRPETPGKRRREGSTFPSSAKKRKLGKTDNNGQDYQNDNYCWECHREGVFICCEMCPRVFHLKCAGMEKEPEEDWACSECHAVMQAENTENRSRSMQLISVEQLCTLLKYALNRLKTIAGMEPFTKPVDTTEFPTYEDIVVHPVDFTSLERNIKRKFYGSTEAFSADARWIVHNSVIFNGANSKVSSMARSLVKILKQEMSEIETCPDCYMNAHQNPKSWFTEVCRSAHPLIWARLKGFPFWPAKAVKWKDGNVDVRFFGRHDRSWVPIKECFLFSEQMPTPLKNRNKTLEACLQEVNEHIAKLREKFGKFKYAPHRIQFNPSDPEQIKIMLPNYKGPVPQRVRPHSRALSRLSAHSDDETSSIASTDSAGGTRRGRRESGTSSATQGTETETEVPPHMSEAPQQRKSDSKSPTQNEGTRREGNSEKEKSKETQYSEEDDVTHSAASLTVKEEEQEDEEMEDCGKYPGQKSSADNSDMEEEEEEEEEHKEDTSSLVNGKSPVIKNEPEGSEEEEEETEEGEGKEGGGGGDGGSGGNSDGEDEERATPASDKDDSEDETEETRKKDIKEEGEEEDDDNDDNKEEEDDEEEEEEEEEDEEEEEEEEEENEDKKELNLQTNGIKTEVSEKSSEEPVKVPKTEPEEKTEDKCVSGENGMRSERLSSSVSANKPVEVKEEIKSEEKENDAVKKALTSTDDEVKRTMSPDSDEQVDESEKANKRENDDDGKEESESKDAEMEGKIKEEDESDDSDDDEDENVDEKSEGKTAVPEDDEGSAESGSEDDEGESASKEGNSDREKMSECDDSTREKAKDRMEDNTTGDSESEGSTVQTVNKESDKKSDSTKDTSERGSDNSSEKMDVDIKKENVTREDEERMEMEAETAEERVIKEEMETSDSFERRDRDEEKREEEAEEAEAARNSLLDAVQLMKTMGTIAITRLDGKSLSDRNGDSITLSRKEMPRVEDKEEERRTTTEETKNCAKPTVPTSKESESKNMEQHISSLGCSVSVTKAVDRDKEKEKDKSKEREKEKVKMPSGVDTTRLSPSISIIPMSGTNERQKGKTTTAPSSPDAITATSSSTAPHPRNASPSVTHNLPQSSPSTHTPVITTRASSSSNSPQTSGANLPPPPPLSHPQAPPSSVGSRGVFGPPPPGTINMGGGRGPIMTTPGIRMVTGVAGPGMMVPARMPAGPPPRHLPPEAGPLSAQLHKHSQKLAEVMRATLEDILGGLVMTGTPEARVAALQLELERTNWRHQQEVAEVRHNADVMLVEMRANLEAEKQRAVDEVKRQMEAQMIEARRQMEVQMMERLAEVRRQMEAEKQRAVEETKRKQWCANCGKEALFFCCWNTSYCDYPCQQSHWPQHMSVCGQNSDGGAGGEGGPESINGEASAHSSRVSTPVQNLVAAQYVEDDGVAALAEEHRRRKMREDDAASLTSSILAQCLIKGNRNRPKKKTKSSSSVKSSPSKDKEKEPVAIAPKAPKSPKAWMEWFLEQSGAEGIKENLQVSPKTGKSKARKSCSKQTPEGPRKKRKSTPCVRRKIEHILKPEEVTAEMLDRVATKPKEKTHDQENGTSCHQCRQKTSDTKTICRSGKCVGLRGFFCGPCLRTRYGEDARKALLDATWSCPVCRGICNCSLCRKAFGQQAVGQIVQRLGKMGYTSVQQYLDSKGIKEEQTEPSEKASAEKELRPEEEEEEESQDYEVAKAERLELAEEEEDCAMET